VAQKVTQLEKQAQDDGIKIERSYTQAAQAREELKEARDKLARVETKAKALEQRGGGGPAFSHQVDTQPLTGAGDGGGSGGGMKRMNSSDTLGSGEAGGSDSDEEEPIMIQKRVPASLDRQRKTISAFTRDNYAKEITEKQGYLYKQGGQGVKTWKRRYFVLRDRQLYYYKNEEGFEKGELLGCISLSGFDSVSQTELKYGLPSRPFTLFLSLNCRFLLGMEKSRMYSRFTPQGGTFTFAPTRKRKCQSGWMSFRMFSSGA